MSGAQKEIPEDDKMPISEERGNDSFVLGGELLTHAFDFQFQISLVALQGIRRF